ncbi:MAG: 3-deoxy-D-manno-octulosonic acid transferase [Desulfomonilaceae bacterium]|nr:3-deoxy-D-manno-octulosonic acid transferase [Desulfomonilaceae bacterium]
MNRFIYNVFLHTIAAPIMAAYYLPRIALGGKYRRSLGGKLGRLPADFDQDRLRDLRIWFHAVSVGEVTALTPLVKAVKELIPQASIVVSTGTETGQARARESILEADGFLYLPLDFPGFVNRVVKTVRPDLFVLMETELWPNLIHRLKVSGARIALANGRISDRSFPRYKKLKPLFAQTLAHIDLFMMSSDADEQRIAEMGAPRDRITVTGNTKFDAALGRIPSQADVQVRRMFDLDDSVRVLVAGSTHPGEHEIVLDAFTALSAKYPDLILIVVPRHVEKAPLIQSAMKSRRMSPALLRSAVDSGERRGDRRVIIVDRIGELFQIYSVASVVFVGGSLVPRGGQNIVEPAAWGKMVLFGPSMEDFREAREILKRVGAGIEITGAKDLTARVDDILSDPEGYGKSAQTGRREIFKHVGSSRKNAEYLSKLVNTT